MDFRFPSREPNPAMCRVSPLSPSLHKTPDNLRKQTGQPFRRARCPGGIDCIPACGWYSAQLGDLTDGRGARSPPKGTLSGTCCPVPSTLTVNYKHTEPPRSSSLTSQPFHALPGGQKLYTRERKFIFKTRSRLTFHQRCQ